MYVLNYCLMVVLKYINGAIIKLSNWRTVSPLLAQGTPI